MIHSLVNQIDNHTCAKRGIYGNLTDKTVFHKLPQGNYGLTEWYPTARTRHDPAGEDERKKTKLHRKNKLRKKAASLAKEVAKNEVVIEEVKGTESPSTAIIDYLKKHPGSRSRDVVAAVTPNVQTKAKQPEKLVYALIQQFIQRGKIRRMGADSKQLEVA